MRRIVCGLIWAVFVLGLTSSAQRDAPATPKSKLIKVGRRLDVRSGSYLSGQGIWVEGERIKEVGNFASVQGHAPKDATLIDLGDAAVLPGLIDAHTHITFDPGAVEGLLRLGISVPREALRGAKNAKVTLESGFTTIRNVGATGFSDIALRDAINDGDLPGPRMVASGGALGITGGHCDSNWLAPEFHYSESGVADGVEQVQHKVRELIKYGADVIKICATGGVFSKGDDPQASQYTLEEMKAIVADAHRLGRKVAAHAHGAQGIRWAAEAGVDSIEHGSYIDAAAIAVMKEKGTYLVPTLYLGYWFLENAERLRLPETIVSKGKTVIPVARENLRHAFESGVKVAFGTDAAVYPHGLNAREFAVYVRMGMTPLRAIQTATLNAADLLGWSDRIGSLEPGRYADLIAVDGDPLKDVTELERVKFVMKGGEAYKNTLRSR